MFTANLKIRGGVDRWLSGLGRWWGRKKAPLRKGADEVARPEPKTEGEKALHQAMGWTDNAWDGGDW